MPNTEPIRGPQWKLSIEGLEVGRFTKFTHKIEVAEVDYDAAGEGITEGLQGSAKITATAERGYMNHDLLKMVIGSPSGDPGTSLKSGQAQPNKQRRVTMTCEKTLGDGTVERVTLYGAWFPSYEWSGQGGSNVVTETLSIRANGIEEN